ncbi:hypothetical protein [Sediminibacterium goheungense]|uniref:GLPGLI family protein n=1 Tax=Sediminibacterium goheungense TaxID=1086393 RepID=A0A4R6IZR4_9BACT|nr:hypothetical protein [Sediminibacterium goheungense]TDO28390.1 hypothetical protein BC659_0455 [Sediminibacterium goheungense]
MKPFTILLFAYMLSCSLLSAQKKDTVYIKPDQINTKVLIPGTHRWLVYFKMGVDSPRSLFSIWSRHIERKKYEGKDAIEIKQVWEEKDSIVHTTLSVSDAKDFRTLFHQSWWKQRGSSSFNFLTGEASMNDKKLLSGDTSMRVKRVRNGFDTALTQYTLNWHLDLEVFPQLPYQSNRTFMINFYDPGFSQPKWVAYSVTGSGKLPGLDGQETDCWLLEHNDTNNKEVYWVSKKTKEVLKLEQQFGTRFRYKIKLPFSM